MRSKYCWLSASQALDPADLLADPLEDPALRARAGAASRASRELTARSVAIRTRAARMSVEIICMPSSVSSASLRASKPVATIASRIA